MLYRIEREWESREKMKELTDEAYAELCKAVLGLPEEKGGYWSELVVDAEGINALVAAGIKVKIKSVKGTYSPDKPISGWQNATNLASHVHIAIPNLGLLTMNRVMVLEDSCTDNLQSYLNDGWRILAVCPPNGVRRPDYVLGKCEE